MTMLQNDKANLILKENPFLFVTPDSDELLDFLEIAALGFFWLSEEGGILRTNRVIPDALGYSSEEMVGHALSQFCVNPNSVDDLLTRLGKDVVHNYPLQLVRKDGGYCEGVLSGSIGTEKLKAPHASCIIRDVTDQKRAERALYEKNKELNEVLSSITDAYVTMDRQWRFLKINRVAAEMVFKRRAEELIGKVFWDEYPHVVGGRFYNEYHEAFREGHPVHFEAKSLLVDRWFETHAYPREDRIEVYLRDITERKKAEHTLREAARRKDEYLSMLAHELRNPLAPVRNAVQLLQNVALSPSDQRQTVEVIDRQIQHMSRLIEDLLDISRMTSGKVKLKKEVVSIRSVVENATNIASPVIQSKNHQFHVVLPDQELLLLIDPVRVAQILENLLTNAAKYTEPDGVIRLHVERVNGEVFFKISDTGVGIAPEMLSSIFDLFTQVDQSLDRSTGGLGIGLTLVHTLVEMHGGRVEAFSEGIGKGSTFVVRLPALQTVEASLPKDDMQDQSMKQIRTRRLLIVDDNIDSAETLAMLLRIPGHEIQVVHDGISALKIARTYQPEVVILDIGLPQMNGYEVALKLREEAGLEKVVLIAMTGYGQEEDRRRSQEVGINHHLVKPIDFDTLQHVIDNSS